MKFIGFIFLLFVLTNTPASGQWQLEWEGPKNSVPLNASLGMPEIPIWNLDANGDGTDDILTLRKDSGEAHLDLVVTSGADPETVWEYGLPDNTDNARFLGFHALAIDGGVKEALVAQRDGNRLIGMLEGGKVQVEDGVLTFGSHYALLGAQDYDLDGKLELYLRDTGSGSVEIWGY